MANSGSGQEPLLLYLLQVEFTFLGLSTGGDYIKSDYVFEDNFRHILAALTEPNRLALEVSLNTGLRISDVLSLPSEVLSRERFTVREQKTGKARRVRLPRELRDELRSIAGSYYIFEGRTDPKKHRTRQAVYKDLKRAQAILRVKNSQISPHSARKIYAVKALGKYGSLKKVQALLNHSDESVTAVYAMADVLTARRLRGLKQL